ncbi:MAPEG family protein [Profundibacterium mesophilum]|uniref:MAPEG family protein n=1 Tax=Profundibacterium mesophilum KAUST100406-0324 TaxID=1037889 RepID=A0A921NX93_9RHOB|nr:MAPEG family protein [Profundibacterium mesophilum]KAF0677358.1 hypothetical protein PMES_00269 [Profundibacterium mesophilum KAUST100406-0324]
MTSELGILGIFGMLVVLVASAERGRLALRGRLGGPEHAGLAPPGSRMSLLRAESVSALVLVAPAILILAQRDAFSGTTILAAQAFLGARLLHLGFGIAGAGRLSRLAAALSVPFVLWLYLAPFLFLGTQSA